MNKLQNCNIALQEVDRVEITTIIDNYSDSTLQMSEPPSAMIKRAPMAIDGKVPSDTLMAEHGLSLLVKIFKNNKQYNVLLDAGWSDRGVLHNLKMLGIDIAKIEAIVISHGHMDHFGALPDVLKRMASPNAALIIHPDAFLRRSISLPGGAMITMPVLNKTSLPKTGVKVVITKDPYLLATDLMVSSGEVERTTDFEKGMSGAFIEREGKPEPDSILDDQGLIINLKGKGLIVITGCAHSGIINTVKYAQNITGVDTVYAIMGGFHLTGPQFMPLTDRTIQELRKLNPSVIIPMHCTCWAAANRIAMEFPAQYRLNSVGTTFSF
ncbi:MAG: hypothetical protein AUJ48_02175 [Deltaproteobacteria bacterium CG1_02_45_11]|nr:MAG: hypothetical protein AUJ48_02175 [Deltaproteobacteria bacterium CG1_02_45_11]